MFTLIIFITCLTALLFPYLIIPMIARLSARSPRPAPSPWTGKRPKVSILIPAHNEALNLRAKLQNCLALSYPKDSLEIIICDDGSTDQSASLLFSLARQTPELRPIIKSARQGKSAAINDMAQLATGDILLLTDASAMLSANTLNVLTDALKSATVGVATCAYGVSTRPVEHALWSREATLKALLAQANMLIGAHGAASALWRHNFSPLPTDTINDDYVLPMRLRAQGLKIAYAPAAIALEPPTPTIKQNMARWRRITQGNVQMIWRYRSLLSTSDWRFTLSILGHKLLKTLGPVWLLGLLGCTIATCALHPTVALVIGALCAALAMLMLMSPSWGARLTFAAAAQLAVAHGLLTTLAQKRSPWSAASPQHQLDLDQPAPIPTHIRTIKRLIDISAAGIGLLLSSPLLILIAALIRATSDGPALFRQERVLSSGPNGERTFTMLKFRTMRQDAESLSGPVWASEQDPRITPLGRLLRKTRLDELPQLFNVLSGQMSLVGPRPERPHFTQQLQTLIPAYEDRICAAKPGITGWAQINCGYDTSIESVRSKLRYDLVYDASLYRLPTYLKMETKILAMTVVVALTGRGAR